MSTNTVYSTAKSAIQSALGKTSTEERKTALEAAAAAIDAMRQKLDAERVAREEKANGAGFQLRAEKVMHLIDVGLVNVNTSPDDVEKLFGPFAIDSVLDVIFHENNLPRRLNKEAYERFRSLFEKARALGEWISGLRLLAATLRNVNAADSTAATQTLNGADGEIDRWNDRLGEFMI